MVTEVGNNVEWCFQRLLYTTLILQVGEGEEERGAFTSPETGQRAQ